MNEARQLPGEEVRGVEVCYCPTLLQEETPYMEEFFCLIKVQDAHDQRLMALSFWACGDCEASEADQNI